MRQSGVALTGGQSTLQAWGRGEFPDPSNDGILTAEEVAGLDLDGTWLVTLSACETGVGQVQSGEGVFGLRRAFMMAGAQNLLMTLWPVSDETTPKIMADFYKRALASGDAAGSLSDVQRDWLVKLRQEKGLLAAIRDAGPFAMVVMANPNVKEAPENTLLQPAPQPSSSPSGSPAASLNQLSTKSDQPDTNTSTKSLADLQATFDQAKRDLSEAISAEVVAQKDFSKTQLIVSGGVGKSEELSLSQQKYQDAVAMVAQKTAAVNALEVALNKQPLSTSSSAPISPPERASGSTHALNEAQNLHDELEKISKSLGGKTN